MVDLFAEGRGEYGCPRIHHELAKKDILMSRKGVIRLMKAQGLCAKTAKKWKANTTDSTHDLPMAPTHLGRDGSAKKPNEKWVSDITSLPTKEGWLYLCIVVELYSRMIVGYSMAKRRKKKLVIDALDMAQAARRPPADLFFPSDQGRQ